MFLIQPPSLEYSVFSNRVENMRYTTGNSYNYYIPKDILSFSKTYQQFNELKDRWIDETAYLSDPDVLFNNSNYKEIIKLGYSVAPFLFSDLFSYKADWFDALTEIFNIDPVKPEHYGDMDAMINDWKIWRLENISYA